MKRVVLLLAAGSALGWCGAALGANIVRDTWLDGIDSDPASPVYSENGVDSDLDGDIESLWYRGGAGTIDPIGPGGPLRMATDIANPTSSSTWTTYFTPEASPVTLASAGDKVRLTWVFTLSGVNLVNTSQNFRVAMVNSPAASRLVADGSPGSSTYSGYSMFMNMGQTIGHSSPFQLREHDNSGALLSGSGDWLALVNDGAVNDTGYSNSTQYTFQMLLERTAASELDITVSMSGGTLGGDGNYTVNFLDATPNGGSFAFDTFAIRPTGASTTAEIFDTSLFQVEYLPVPEPTSLGLLSLAGLAMLRRNRG